MGHVAGGKGRLKSGFRRPKNGVYISSPQATELARTALRTLLRPMISALCDRLQYCLTRLFLGCEIRGVRE